MRLRLLPTVLAAALGCAVHAPVAAPQEAPKAPARADDPASRAERLRRAQVRWAKMTPEQRERIRGRFEDWQRLPAEKREILRRRFEELGPEGVGLAHRRLEELRRNSPEHLARMRQKAENLRRLEGGLVEELRPLVRARYERMTAEDRERVRLQLGRALLEMGREQMLRAHATEEERRALREGTPEERRAAQKAVFARVHREVLEPHRRDLEALSPDQRRARKADLLEAALWRRVREERVADIRAAFLKFVQENGAAAGRLQAEKGDRFRKAFGVGPDEVGDGPAARALMIAAFAEPPERREAFLERLRPEIRRIVAGVPAERRGDEIRALLERMR